MATCHLAIEGYNLERVGPPSRYHLRCRKCDARVEDLKLFILLIWDASLSAQRTACDVCQVELSLTLKTCGPC